MPTAPALRVDDITVRYSGVQAVDGVSFVLEPGAIVGLIGPNGAGKTSLIDAISGFARYSGSVQVQGVDIDSLAPHLRSRRGVVRSFQGAELFDDLTVEENVLLGAGKASRSDARQQANRALEFLELERFANVRPTALSTGQRKLVGVARAIAGNPAVLLLDEPAAGLDSTETAEFAEKLPRLAELGTTVMLVDHDMDLMLRVCHYLHVLDLGRLIATGTPEEIRRDPAVQQAYLGNASATHPAADTAKVGPASTSRHAARPVGGVRLSGVSASYGRVQALDRVDLNVEPGEIVGVLGPNGAGKTTLLRVITGQLPTSAGDVLLGGQSQERKPPHRRVRRGLAVIPERRGIFATLTVTDNLSLGAPRDAETQRTIFDRFPVLRERRNVRAGLLSGGEQQLLAVARAFAATPSTLLIDELTLGLAPAMAASLTPTITQLAEDGAAVLLVDQNTELVLSLATRCYVLVAGRIVHTCTTSELRHDPQLLADLYLGSERSHP